MRLSMLTLALLFTACTGAEPAPVDCNGTTCAVGEVCVVTTASGGACLQPDDAGVCPDGTHTAGCCNQVSTTYACQRLPAACGGSAACPCAESLCQCGGCAITDAGAVACTCAYP